MKITWKEMLNQIQRIGHLTDLEFSQDDYKPKCVSFVNNALLDLATTNGKQYRYVSFVNRNLENNLDTEREYIYDNTNGTIVFTFDKDASVSYTFAYCGKLTFDIEEYVNGAWANVCTTSLYSNIFTEYKGFMPAFSTASENTRMVFNSDYIFNIKNVAVYSHKFSDSEYDIPSYSAIRTFDIKAMANRNDDSMFMAFSDDNVIKNGERWLSESEYNFIDDHTISLSAYNTGEFSVYYIAYPDAIKENITDSEEIDIEPQYAALIPLFVASNIYFDDDQILANTCYNKYLQLKSQLYSQNYTSQAWKRYYNYEK